MNEQITDFIKANKICVMGILREDGSIHGATVHYSSNKDLSEFYIATHRGSRKAQRLLTGDEVKASLVVGFSEEEMITYQADGNAQIINPGEELEKVKAVHYAMHPFAKKFEGDPETIFIKFKPEWWRYSAFKETPPVFINSEE